MANKIQKNISRFLLSALFVAAVTLLSSCGNKNEWTVNGVIDGADGETMLLEASDNGRWYAIDSVMLDASGRFKMSEKPCGYPDIYRLRLGNKTLYFPIDSIETVTVISNASAFDTEYTLEGSPSAQKLMEVDRRLMDLVNKSGVKAVASDSLLKRELGGIILGDQTGIVSYYIINKRIGGVPIFDPANKGDLRIIGAVANAFNEFRPKDPRTAYLKNLYLNNRVVEAPMRTDTIHTTEISLFDIKLYDEQGRQQSLQHLSDEGKVILLNFTVYGAEASPAFNIQLNKVYEKYRDRGLEIFQVGIDEDEASWRQTARNLPWVTVYASPVTGGRTLLNYNVTDLPTSFIIDRHGNIVERVEDINRLDALVGQHM